LSRGGEHPYNFLALLLRKSIELRVVSNAGTAKRSFYWLIVLHLYIGCKATTAFIMAMSASTR
jgi:hypothetical protein